jgi:predicted RNA binding protein YcfA (HicA-like mRNA interferase family)
VSNRRDISYTSVIKLLKHIGYAIDDRKGSHIKLKASSFKSKTIEDIITIQAHNPLVVKAVDKTLKKASEQTGIPFNKLKRMLEDY